MSRRMGDRPFASQAELNLAQALLRRGPGRRPRAGRRAARLLPRLLARSCG